MRLKNDLYSVEVGSVRKLQWKRKLKEVGIYVDNLVQTLDDIIG